jgi:hypothetical protein
MHNNLAATMVNQTQRLPRGAALADLRAKQARYPTAELARMIRRLLAEVGERKRPS